MYYKLLNKTILSSAFVTLICLSGGEAYSQELFGDEEQIDIVMPASDDISFEIEDDIIPLSEEELISPEAQQEPTKEEKTSNNPSEVKEAPADKNPEPQKEITEEKPAPKAEVEQQELIVEKPAPKAETIKAPEENIEDDFVDSFEINFNEEPETKDLFEQAAEPTDEQIPEAPVKTSPDKKLPDPKNVRKDLKKDALNKAQPAAGLKFGDAILVQTNNDLFNQMSDIEKQTTLLSLELKRERIRNEVEAAKAVRERAEFEKQAQEEAKKRQEAEWKNQQEINLINAQEALRQKEIELEKVRQRKALTAYMNSMLEQKQLWITENGKLYDEIRDLKETNATLRSSYKNDMSNVETQSSKILKSAETARNNYERAIASLTAQNAQLRKRIESMEQAAKANPNPFAEKSASGNQISTSADALIKPINISKEYAIMEITGQGDELFVKLINKEGDSFVAKTGTILSTGHMIEEITPNYVQFDRNGLKDFLYTASSALSIEPNRLSDNDQAAATARTAAPARPRASLISDDGLPSVGNSMFVK